MNCKKGDLAWVVVSPSDKSAAWLNRKIVTCVKLTRHPESHKPAWVIAEKLTPPWCKCGKCGPYSINDEVLRPIKPGEGDDETLTWKPVPATPDLVPA